MELIIQLILIEITLKFNLDLACIYRGQCSEICGTGHGYMPIVIEALNETDFNNWIIEQKNKLAMSNNINNNELIIE